MVELRKLHTKIGHQTQERGVFVRHIRRDRIVERKEMIKPHHELYRKHPFTETKKLREWLLGAWINAASLRY